VVGKNGLSICTFKYQIKEKVIAVKVLLILYYSQVQYHTTTTSVYIEHLKRALLESRLTIATSNSISMHQAIKLSCLKECHFQQT